MLRMGDTIGIFSPSYPATAAVPEATARAKEYLEGKGFRIKMGNLTGKRDFYRSGTAKERAEEFNTLLRDPEVGCIMAAMGGMVSNAMLPYLDYQAFARVPKPVVGHSDVTALLLGLYAKTEKRTYYGPNFVSSFGQEPAFSDFSLENLLAALKGEKRACPIPPFYSDELTDWQEPLGKKEQKPNRWVTVFPGKAEGRLLGGNLNTLSGLMGTPYLPEFRRGDILFLEDTEKFAAHAERYFSLLKLSGILDRAGGILLGKHRQFDNQGTGKAWADILLEVLDGKQVPILADVDCCHTTPMLTLPLGGKISMDTERKELILLAEEEA